MTSRIFHISCLSLLAPNWLEQLDSNAPQKHNPHQPDTKGTTTVGTMATPAQPPADAATVQVDDDDQHLQTEHTPLLSGEAQRNANDTYPDDSDLLEKG